VLQIKFDTFRDPHFIDLCARECPIIVVYYNPLDHPGKYVARLWGWNCVARPEYVKRDSLEEIRNCIPKGMCMIPREPSDDPVIVEIWA